MKTQIKFLKLNFDYVDHVNKVLAEYQPPRYQVVDIKVVPAGNYTEQCNLVVVYNEYEVNND